MSASSLLHLRPRSRDSQRVWHVGEPSSGTNGAGLRLAVRPDRHENFASLAAILAQLEPLAPPDQRGALTKVGGYLREACPGPVAGGNDTHGQLLADSVTFAIMRRVSRESFYTARLIDSSARAINMILSRLPGCTRVHVDDVDRLDRPTLKVLARAMLLLEPSHGFSWVWHSASDPTASLAESIEDLFVVSRGRLLRQLVGLLVTTERRHAAVAPLARPAERPSMVSIYDVSAALVMQNYDACFLWCDELLRRGLDWEVSEGLRLRALAAVNVGSVEEALSALGLAEQQAVGAGRRAHLSYIQGLIEAKRRYDLSGSCAHYERGLAALAAADQNGEDLSLERGWLLNGLALNEAILWRRNPAAMEHHARAFALEREAFDLVRDGDHPARMYLRLNLLANSAFLMEMRGKYDLAIDVFHRTFDFGPNQAPAQRHRWLSTMGYRIGMLHYRAGRLDEAYRLLQEAAEQDAAMESWPTQERILRALGVVAFDSGAFSEAAAVFRTGLEICRGARSAEGTREHARGLMAALAQDGKGQQAEDIADMLAAEEGEAAVPAERPTSDRAGANLRPSPPSPKLPAYIPEIDLEGIPPVDLNRFLGKALSRDARVAVWKS
jgi:tetratricopeptide (TPR) repeat protein